MDYYVSTAIAPLCLIILFLYIVIYYAANLISKPVIRIFNILLLPIIIALMIVGTYALYKGNTMTLELINSSWDILSYQSRVYYYNNDIKELFNIYYRSMTVTGGLLILLGVSGILTFIFQCVLYFKLNVHWRPPLQSRLSDERAQRYINFYSKHNEEYKKLLESENAKKPENFTSNLDNIIEKADKDIIGLKPSLDAPILMDENAKLKDDFNSEKKNEEFNLDGDQLNQNDEIKPKKRILPSLRKKKKDVFEENNN